MENDLGIFRNILRIVGNMFRTFRGYLRNKFEIIRENVRNILENLGNIRGILLEYLEYLRNMCGIIRERRGRLYPQYLERTFPQVRGGDVIKKLPGLIKCF